MKPLFQKTILFISFGLIFAAGSKAQENDTWIELMVTNDYVEALATANLLNLEFDEIGIVSWDETSYAIVSGPFDLTTARERLELFFASPNGKNLTLALTDGSIYQKMVWSKGSIIDEELAPEPVASSSTITIPFGLVDLEIDPTTHEILPIEIFEAEEDFISSIVSNENTLAKLLDHSLEGGDDQLDSLEISEDQLQDKNTTDVSDEKEMDDAMSEVDAPESIPLTDALAFAKMNQNKQIQLALRMVGFYAGDVDGIFGSQSEAAVSLYQRRNGEEETGELTQTQLARLNTEAEEVIGFAESLMLNDKNLGLKVILPTALLELRDISYPYVVLAPNGFRDINVVLISMDGGNAGLRALHAGLLRHAKIPADGNEIQNGKFRISYSDFSRNIVASARLFGDRIRGVIVSWNPDQDSWMNDYSQVIAGSLGEVNGNTRFVLEDLEPLEKNLQVLNQSLRQEPKLSSTGFFVSSAGDILTNYKNVEDCTYISADFNQQVRIRKFYRKGDLALLEPVDKVSPLHYAALRENLTTFESDIILGGYSFGGLVNEASITRGTLANVLQDTENGTNYILELPASNSDFGGPILDTTGSVIGILTREVPQGKILPQDTHMAQTSDTIINFLKTSGLDVKPSNNATSMDLLQLSRMARDFTVLIRCF